MDLARRFWTTSLEMCGEKALEPSKGTVAQFDMEKLYKSWQNIPELESNRQITTANETYWSALVFDKIKSHHKQP